MSASILHVYVRVTIYYSNFSKRRAIGHMGNKSSKSKKPTTRSDEATGFAPDFSVQSPAKLLALDPDAEARKRLKAWCKTDVGAKERKLGEIVECWDEIVKRGVVYRASIRCE